MENTCSGPIPLTHWERMRRTLIPSLWCELPEAPSTWKDVLVIQTTVELSFRQRLIALLTGVVKVETKTVCENVIGNVKTNSVGYAHFK